jgi:hypothetical protein
MDYHLPVICFLKMTVALPHICWQRSYQIRRGWQRRPRHNHWLPGRVSRCNPIRHLRGSDIWLSPSDIIPLNFVYKKTREIFRRMPSYRGEPSTRHPSFKEGSAAACREASGPVDMNAPDIIYTAEDDEVIDKFHRDNSKSWF